MSFLQVLRNSGIVLAIVQVAHGKLYSAALDIPFAVPGPK